MTDNEARGMLYEETEAVIGEVRSYVCDRLDETQDAIVQATTERKLLGTIKRPPPGDPLCDIDAVLNGGE